MSATAKVIPLKTATTTNATELALVRKCVDCGAAIAADTACYRIDPDHNNTTSGPAAHAHGRRATKLLGEIANMPALTIDGVQAKAKLALAMFKWREPDGIGRDDDKDQAFLASFAADVDRYLETMRWSAS